MGTRELKGIVEIYGSSLVESMSVVTLRIKLSLVVRLRFSVL